MRSLVRWTVVAFAAIVLGAAPALAVTWSVNIQSFAFSPSTLTITVGDSVTWTNRDASPHSVHWTSGGQQDSPVLPLGQSFTTTFTSPGTFTYVCGVHGSSMSGTVRVLSATLPPTTAPPPTAPPPTSAPPSPTASPPPSPSASPPTLPSPSVEPSATTTARPSPTASGTPPPAPAAQANTLIGLALVAVGAVILGGAFWWRFGRR